MSAPNFKSRLGSHRVNRRTLIGAAVAATTLASPFATVAQVSGGLLGAPIGLPDRLPGDGFLIRHGYACENTWYNPGWWHTGEDWYLTGGVETTGALIYSVADGEVVFAGSNYPGRVVIVQHGDALFSMYGHLEYEPLVEAGEPVVSGQVLGSVLFRNDGAAPSHLHFEMRTFLTTVDVNGDAPRYDVGCGFQCPPGPGYWPIDAPEHPTALGWRNPTHLLAGRGFAAGPSAIVVADPPPIAALPLLSTPDGDVIGELALVAGERFTTVDASIGPEASDGTSAEAYQLWYQLALAGGSTPWVQAAIPSTADTGSDGRPSSILLPFVAG